MRSAVGNLFTIVVVLLKPPACVHVLDSVGIECGGVLERTVSFVLECEVTSNEGSGRIVDIPSDRSIQRESLIGMCLAPFGASEAGLLA